MTRLTFLLAAVLAATSLAGVGCCDKEKKQLAEIQQQYNQLQLDNQDLKKSLADCQSKSAELMAQVSSSRSALSRAQDELTRLKAAKPAPGTGKPPAGWEQTVGGVKTTLSSDILFASGRATLSSAGAARLRAIAVTIKSQYPGDVVRVMGYTDNDPIVKSAKLWKDNLDLSANRAMAVTRQLRKLGIPAERVETVAMGQTHPVASNTTRAGKAKNRRVEIVVVEQ
jgi:flagellar motor protein MotB